MRALVTGSNGHIGSNVVRACLDAGVTPVGLVRRGSDRRALAGLDVAVVEGDVLDPSSVERAMAGVDTVFHVAGVHRNWAENDAAFIRPAVEGTRNVLAAARRAGVRRVVCTSSGATVGFSADPARPLDESATLSSAKSAYIRSKIEAEKVALAEAERGGLDVIVVNPTGVLGPYDYRLTPATRGVLGLLQGDPLFFALTLTDVRDVARGHLLAAANGANGRRYLLAGERLAPTQIAETLEVLVGIRPRTFRPPLFLLHWAAAAAVRRARKTGEDAAITTELVDDVYGRHLVYDARRAREELGVSFRPTTDVLRDAVRWMLFVDALKPKVAATVRAALGASAAPDAEWRVAASASTEGERASAP